MNNDASLPPVYFDPVDGALYVSGLRTTDRDVLNEASRWVGGVRGERVELDELRGQDLSAFAREALKIGARVIAIASQNAETLAVQEVVKTASENVSDAVARASTATDDAMKRVASDISESARMVQDQMTARLQELFGGEDPQLLQRIQPVLTRVGTDMEKHIAVAIERSTVQQRQDTEDRHKELTAMIRDVREDVAVRVAEQAAAAEIKEATTLKGFDYEAQLNVVLTEIAVGFGDEYLDTGSTVGVIAHNKKGDGVLVIEGDKARIVFEAHDGSSKDWNSYLAIAEQNRQANVSLGLVKHLEDNSGQAVRVIGPRRLVLAFNPEVDDINLLRTVVLLLRTVALTSSGRFGAEEVATAQERVKETLTVLSELDVAKKSASAITGHVDRIEKSIARTLSLAQRTLNQALVALEGSVEPEGSSAPVIELAG